MEASTNSQPDQFPAMTAVLAEHDALIDRANEVYLAEVQKLVDKHNVHLATGRMSDNWRVRRFGGRIWRDALDENPHPIFAELEELDAIAIRMRIGPTNLMLIHPTKKP